MKKVFGIVLLCAVAVSAMAVPARRGWLSCTQADGTTIEVQQVGDEFYHYTINKDGKEVRLNAAGMYEVVGDAPTATIARTRRAQSRRARREFGVTPNLAPRGIVILVNFKNRSFDPTHTREVIDSLCNAVDCKVNKWGNKSFPSAGQYFSDQSNGTYHPIFDVYGPVTLSNNMMYYGENTRSGDDKRPAVAVVEACKMLENEVDFTLYDSDNDGKIDFVYMIYAGTGENATNNANEIWPHAFSIDEEFAYRDENFTNVYPTKEDCKVDGKQINTYACSAELSDNELDGIGTLCHEFGHVMGLPDFYDTNYGSNYDNMLTPNEWDVMDGGAYNGDSHCPPNYSAWEKYFMGWVTPENPGDKNASLTLYPNGNDQYNVYQINASGTLEDATKGGLNYYIEFRHKQGWDSDLPGEGMLIWYVNYNRGDWINNVPNNTDDAPRYTLMIPFGTKIGGRYGARNVWPYGATDSWDGVEGKELSEITKTDSTITLNYVVSTQDVEKVEVVGKASKTIENGRVVILREGKKYDILGNRL